MGKKSGSFRIFKLTLAEQRQRGELLSVFGFLYGFRQRELHGQFVAKKVGRKIIHDD